MLRTFSHFYGSRDIVAHYSHLSFVVSFRFSFLVLLSLGEKWATPKAFLASVVNLFFLLQLTTAVKAQLVKLRDESIKQ